MSLVVAREVEGFLFRPGVTARARYTAIVFLNQLTLSHREADKAVAVRLPLHTLTVSLNRLSDCAFLTVSATASPTAPHSHRV